MSYTTRCPQCARILFTDDANRLPAHKVPPEPVMHGRQRGLSSVPFPMPNVPWCPGIKPRYR